jgi:hypothetical protein
MRARPAGGKNLIVTERFPILEKNRGEEIKKEETFHEVYMS